MGARLGWSRARPLSRFCPLSLLLRSGFWVLCGGQDVAHVSRAAPPPLATPLQEHPEPLPGAGGHPGAEPRAAAQVHHAGHRHHAEAGKVPRPQGPVRLQGRCPGLGVVGSQPRWDEGPPGDGADDRVPSGGAADLSFWGSPSHPTHTHTPPQAPCAPRRDSWALTVLSFQGPRVEILAKNLRVKDQVPQGAPR